MGDKLKITSYNCNLFNDKKINFCKELFNNCDFLLLQEHGLFESNFNFLYNIDSNIKYCSTSQMNENVILTGGVY